MSILPRAFAVTSIAALIAASAAFAQTATKYGPDLRVVGQAQGKTSTTSVALNLTLSPFYASSKPGVTVTMRNCTGAALRLLRRAGGLGAGQSLHAASGQLVWNVSTVPGKPSKPKLGLILAPPAGKKTLCVSTSMYDNYTHQTVRIRTAIPL